MVIFSHSFTTRFWNKIHTYFQFKNHQTFHNLSYKVVLNQTAFTNTHAEDSYQYWYVPEDSIQLAQAVGVAFGPLLGIWLAMKIFWTAIFIKVFSVFQFYPRQSLWVFHVLQEVSKCHLPQVFLPIPIFQNFICTANCKSE